MYDFKDYITHEKNVIPDNLDIFRSDPPIYVRKTACAIQEIAKKPRYWRNVLKKYKIRITKFKHILCLSKKKVLAKDVKLKVDTHINQQLWTKKS